jgi:urease accessory protein
MMMDRFIHADVQNGPSSADGGGLGRNRVSAAASIVAVAAADGRTRLPVLASQVPLVLRQTPEAVYVVGGAAGPVGGDELALRISVGTGALLRVRTAAASIALPGPDGRESVLRVTVDVAAGARLEYLPEPVVVSAGARHATIIRVALADGASLLLRDELLLGRHGEAGGAGRTELHVSYAGRPLLRQSLEVSGTDAADLGPAVLGGHRAVGALLHASPAVDALAAGASDPLTVGANETAKTALAEVSGAAAGADGTADAEQGRAGSADAVPTTGPAVAVMPLAGPGILVTALADDAVTLRRCLSATPSTRIPTCQLRHRPQ